MELSRAFPRYEQFSPRVPVWCVTPNQGGCIHRFFDTPPISPSGRLLAVFRMPFEDHLPRPGDKGQVVVIDLAKGTERVVAETCGWETQMGANVNWGATNSALFFNDVDTTTWKPFAWKLDPESGKRECMEGTVYHASPDGKWLISSNLSTMRTTQPGYGVVVPDERARRNVGLVADDGFYLTDTATGRCRMLVSIRDMVARADPAVQAGDLSRQEIYGFHSKFNPQSERLMLSLRWFPALAKRRWDMFALSYSEVRYAWITMPLDAREMHCAIGPEQWDKGGHHATFFPDGKRISMNLAIDRECLRFVQVNWDGAGLAKMRDDTVGSGHPTVHCNGTHLLTDTYEGESVAYGDGTIPLRWIELATGKEEALVRMNIRQPHAQGALRIDPHPAWDRTWRYVTFNGSLGGTRRVFVADMKGVL